MRPKGVRVNSLFSIPACRCPRGQQPIFPPLDQILSPTTYESNRGSAISFPQYPPKETKGVCSGLIVCHLVFAIPLHIGPKGQRHGSGRPFFRALKPCPVSNYMRIKPGSLFPFPPSRQTKEK